MSSVEQRHQPGAVATGASGSDHALALLVGALAREIGLYASGPAPIDQALENAINMYVWRLRGAGLPAERVLVSFKQLVRVALPAWVATDALHAHARMEHLVTRCIVAYYGSV